MWNKVTIEKGIRKYKIGYSEVFAIGNGEIRNDNLLTLLPFQSHKGYNSIFLTYKSSIYYSTYENELFEFNGNTKEERKIEDYSGALSSNCNEIFVLVNENGTIIIDLESNRTVWNDSVRLSSVVSSSKYVAGKTGRKGKEVCVVDIEAKTQFNIPLIAGLVQILNYRDESILLFYEDGRMQSIDFLSKDEIWTIQAVNLEKLSSVKWHLLESENKAY
ncbi:MAG: hypothetical protein RJQ14_09190, partial [Marinoscillum sp.]